ncbi:hypothetical protein HII31_01982 [Pseudocercospora fuligena]|uniref:Uncharacterized protein n=1 Tax=Pseudocercospora fuligena TaxID=685502 RepID=A0A8H6RTK1_9PEZI|nr:hypothetical protein HII31_01982 [Pseudocercospora fuligena]
MASTPPSASQSAINTSAGNSAAAKVLHITELLEQILLSMFEKNFQSSTEKATAMRSLLRCQRINHTFKAVIEGSVLLQDWLRYSSRSDLVTSSFYGNTHINPLFYDHSLLPSDRFPLEITESNRRYVEADIWIHKAALESAHGNGSWRNMRLFGSDAKTLGVAAYGHSDHLLGVFKVEGSITAGEFMEMVRKWMKAGLDQKNGQIW